MDDDNWRPYCIENVAKAGNIAQLEWLHNKYDIIIDWLCWFRASQNGHLHVMQWLKSKTTIPLYNDLLVPSFF